MLQILQKLKVLLFYFLPVSIVGETEDPDVQIVLHIAASGKEVRRCYVCPHTGRRWKFQLHHAES